MPEKLFLSLDKMLFHTSDAKRTNNTSLTKAIRTRIAQMEAGNALEILRQSQQTYVPQRTTKPRTDPHGRHGQTQPKDDPTHQVSCGRRGRWSRASAELPPLSKSRETGSKLYPEPKTQTGNTETLPFNEEDKQRFLCQLLLAIKFSPSNRATVPGGGRYEHGTWMTEFD